MTLPLLSKSTQDLPDEVTTPDGANFDPRSDWWVYRDSTTDVSINFSKLNVTPELLNSIKIVLIWYVKNKSTKHMINMFNHLKRMLVAISKNEKIISKINSTDIINYRASLPTSNSWYLGNLSGFLQKWHSLGLNGVSDDAIALLKQLRIAGNKKGEAVSTMDPLNGPFTDFEVEAIHTALERAYISADLNIGDFLLIWLFLALGQRPVQYASLKVCDFDVCEAKDGTTIYSLNMPRAKQRGQLARSAFSQRVLVPKIGVILVQYIEILKAKFAQTFTDLNQSPLFPTNHSSKNEPIGFEFHRTSKSLANDLKQALNQLNVVSERTGRKLHITATRFRRTLGTRAAMEGHGELVIAELLDHTDTQNVGVYVQATPEIVERIDKAMALYLAPLAQAFAGVIIKNESKALRKGDLSSRICDPRFEPSMKPMGNCGQHGFCGDLAPISCYTCSSFQPWLDGPHQAVLDYLISERDRLVALTDFRIASVNDRTILAVAEVVRRCGVIKAEKNEAHNG